jgi:pimeloyl-ACP methyl ester carboxylesterase
MVRSSRSRPAQVEPTRVFEAREVRIPPMDLAGTLRLPCVPGPVVVLVQVGGGNDARLCNTTIGDAFNQHGLGTLLFDLLAAAEAADGGSLLDIPRLAERTVEAVHWLAHEPALAGRALGLFAAGTGTAAALVAAAKLGEEVGAVVSRDGRPDLAGETLDGVRAPTLLIVGGLDTIARELNRQAFARLQGPKVLEIVPDARHLSTEPGALEMVIVHATRWFEHYLRRGHSEAKQP